MLMNPDTDNFMQKIFQASRLEDADVTSMEQLVLQYPYYAPLQYILAKKYRQVNNTRYKPQITKTAVFFSNPHWLNDLLLSDGTTSSAEAFTNASVNGTHPVQDVLPPQTDVVLPEQNPEHGIAEALTIEPQQDTEESMDPDDPGLTQPIAEREEDQLLAQQDESGYEANIPSFNEGVAPDTPPAENNTEPLSDSEIIPAELQEDIVQEIPDAFPEDINEDAAETGRPAPLVETGSDMSKDRWVESDTATADGLGEATISGSNPMNLEPEEESPGSLGAPGMDAGEHTTVPENREPASPADNLSGNPVKSGSSASPDQDNFPLIPIEPLYAVDYFASQGIKLKDEDGKDKLSQKLRSFTEWLKTMKRIHPEKLEQEMDSRTSTVIQHIAEHSNELEDVVTEAMAEVYARQGLRNKAAEVYQKLSLLNPNKRAYFAAKISKLNET